MSSSDEDLTMETNDTQHEEGAQHQEEGHGGEETRAKRSAVGGRVEHFTVAERTARGKATRAEVSRASHGDWEPAAHRPDPVELLEEQAKSRVPELVPIRYGRMLVSPFTFYRGAAYLMASDLASGPEDVAPHAALRRCASLELRRLSPRPTARSSSASTTSTRRCPARSSGTSSGSSRALPSRGAIAASTRSSARRPTSRSAVRTARASRGSRR